MGCPELSIGKVVLYELADIFFRVAVIFRCTRSRAYFRPSIRYAAIYMMLANFAIHATMELTSMN